MGPKLKKFRHLAPSTKNQLNTNALFLLALTSSLLVAASQLACGEDASTSGLQRRDTGSSGRQVDRFKVKGWAEVSERWPMEHSEFFVAFAKGHHFIEVKLPVELGSDLEVRLEYYYNFAKVKPSLQMVPCTENIDLLADSLNSEQRPGVWLNHEIIVKASDCQHRNVLAYNVLLHDENDVFAWRFLSIKSRQPEVTTARFELEETSTTRPVDLTTTTGSITPLYTLPPVFADRTTMAPATTPTTDSTPSSTKPFETNTFYPTSIPETTSSTQAPTTIRSSGGETYETATATFAETSTGSSSSVATSAGEQSQPTTTLATNHETVTARDEQPGESMRAAFPVEGRRRRRKRSIGSINQFQSQWLVRNRRDVTESSSKFETNTFFPTSLPETSTTTTRMNAADSGSVNWFCRPGFCDRSVFQFPRFRPLVKGVPQMPRMRDNEEGKYFLALDEKPLDFQIESASVDLFEVDTCLEWHLFMDAGTELELRVEDSRGPDRLLELIERRHGDSAAGKWELFKRCISDYMPRLLPSNNHSTRISVSTRRPTSLAGDKQVAIVVNPAYAISLSGLHEPRAFLANAPQMASAEEVTEVWLMDRDGYRKPQVQLVDGAAQQVTPAPESSTQQPQQVDRPSPETTTSTSKRLLISGIDPRQETFDITSRWLQVRDVIDPPLLFLYVAERAPWIQSVEFQFQSANKSTSSNESLATTSGGWISQTVYTKPSEEESTSAPTASTEATTTSASASGPQATGAVYEGSSSEPASSSPTRAQAKLVGGRTAALAAALATTQAKTIVKSDSTETATTTTTQLPPVDATGSQQMRVPLKLNNLNSDEFRIRVRHHLTEAARSDPSRYLELSVATLAFGDLCAEPGYCRNGGACQPIGTARAQCTCLQGFSGPHCEQVQPCSVMHGTQTGKQLCESAGARCDENMVKLRCRWPEDPLYNMTAYDPTLANSYAAQANDGSFPIGNAQASTEQLSQLREQSDSQSRMIIIMSVFMLALLLFAVVIVANMVSRLVKSKRRLKRAQIEVHELAAARRADPASGSVSSGPFASHHQGATGALAGIGRRKPPPAIIAYSNQSFDAD